MWSDALRFSLVEYTTGNGDIAFDVKEIEAKQRLCNKIYQRTNLCARMLGSLLPSTSQPWRAFKLAEECIMHKLNAPAETVNDAIDSRKSSVSTQALYQHWHHGLSDTFIEKVKPPLRPQSDSAKSRSVQKTLCIALEGGLLLLHLVMPFWMEQLWQKLPQRQSD